MTTSMQAQIVDYSFVVRPTDEGFKILRSAVDEDENIVYGLYFVWNVAFTFEEAQQKIINHLYR